MLSNLWNLAAFIITVSILITIHEFGHFWIARRCGVKVERFAIGFGKVLLQYVDKYGTEFVISLIPIGGYTKMFDDNEQTLDSKKSCLSFNCKTISQRASIIIAGPTANFIFSILIYSLLFVYGVPSVRPIVDQIASDSIADNAKITPNMEFKSIDGVKTPDWDTFRLQLVTKIGKNSTVVSVVPLGSHQCLKKILNLKNWTFNPNQDIDPLISLGIYPRNIQVSTVLEKVYRGSAASKSGLQAGDKIIKVNDQLLKDWITFSDFVHNSPKQPLFLEIERNSKKLFLILTPDVKLEKNSTKVIGYAGVSPKIISLPEEYQTIYRYNPLYALYKAIKKTWQLIEITVHLLIKVMIGDLKISNLSGPLSIAKKAGISAKFGMTHYLMFLALISTNLGVINLFPFPILDGGYLIFLIIEKLRNRPVSRRIQDISYRVASILLILLMGLVLFNDFSRL